MSLRFRILCPLIVQDISLYCLCLTKFLLRLFNSIGLFKEPTVCFVDSLMHTYITLHRLPWWPSGKEFTYSVRNTGSPAMQEIQVRSLGWEDPLEKEMKPTPVFFVENSKDRGIWLVTVHGITKSQT